MRSAIEPRIVRAGLGRVFGSRCLTCCSCPVNLLPFSSSTIWLTISEAIMVDIIHRVGIKAPVSKVYDALATVEGVAGWWTRDTTGVAKPGGAIDVRFLRPTGEEIGGMTMEVLAL